MPRVGAEMNEREALKLALEALDCICSPLHVREIEKVGNAMKAIKEALAQPEQESDDLTIAYMSGFHAGKNKDAPQPKPEQEPVAWMREDEDCTDCIVWEQTEEHTIPLYITPPQPKPLTDEEIFEIHKQVDSMQYLTFARAIEAAHGIKGE